MERSSGGRTPPARHRVVIESDGDEGIALAHDERVGPMSDEPIFLPPPNHAGVVPPLADRLSPRGVTCELAGLAMMAMPPGQVDIDLKSYGTSLCVLPSGGIRPEQLRIDGLAASAFEYDGPMFELFAPCDRFELICTNPHWEVLIELDEARLPLLASEAHEGSDGGAGNGAGGSGSGDSGRGGGFAFDRPHVGGQDGALTELGRLAIQHLRHGPPDRLYAEGLAIAMTARAMLIADERARTVPTGGTDARIARAIDYAEANLDRSIGVAELAAAAGMSPSWFQTSFRAIIGTPVHAYVTERRLDRARRMLTDPTASGRARSIAQIAYACGFADASHLGRAFKRRFGTTPGRAREG